MATPKKHIRAMTVVVSRMNSKERKERGEDNEKREGKVNKLASAKNEGREERGAEDEE